MRLQVVGRILTIQARSSSNPEPEEGEECTVFTAVPMLSWTRTDYELGEVAEFKANPQEFERDDNGIWWRKVQQDQLIGANRLVAGNLRQRVVPTTRLEEVKGIILETLHDHLTAGHQGQNRTYAAVRELFYWKGMKKDCFN